MDLMTVLKVEISTLVCVCSEKQFARILNKSKIPCYSMVNYLEMMKWFALSYDLESYIGRNLSPVRSNLAKQANGQESDKTFVTLRSKLQ